jgi:hypothetical protein
MHLTARSLSSAVVLIALAIIGQAIMPSWSMSGGLCAAEAENPVLSSAKLVWHAGQPTSMAVPPLSKTLTILASFKDLKASGEVLSWKGKEGRCSTRWAIEDVQGWRSLHVELATDARPNPLHLFVPLVVIGEGSPHEVVLRYLGYRLELFVDGVLLDEEWPMGAILPAESPLVLSGDSITQMALWDHAISEDALAKLFGDPAALAERKNRYLGTSTPGQYWRPAGPNAYAGDCMPFFHEGRFHLFYLFDRHHHTSKWGLGAHQWAHMSTTDLVHWDQHPMAVPISDEQEGSICTGSTFFHDGVYYAFYAARTNDGSPAPLCGATSNDGIHFTKQPPLSKLTAPYTGGSARDPVVFQEKSTGLFHMLLTSSIQDPAIGNRGGCLAHLTSPDLKKWDQHEPFILPGYPGEPECADYFEWHGWYYLVFSNQGIARYRMSKNPMGPWLRPTVDVFEGPQAAVMKTAAFTGDRRLGVAFMCAGGYAGDVIFREIFQNADGTLGTRWPKEMIPSAETVREAASVKLKAVEDLQISAFGKEPTNFLLRAHVKPAPKASYYGIRFHAGDKMQGGFELRFEPQREKVGLRPGDAGSNEEHDAWAIYNVTGLDQPFDIEMVSKGDIIDVCVDHRRTLIARVPKSTANLFFFAQNAEVEFEKVELKAISH